MDSDLKCVKAAVPLQRGSLFLTTKFLRVPGTSLTFDWRKYDKIMGDHGATQLFLTCTGSPGLGVQHPHHYAILPLHL